MGAFFCDNTHLSRVNLTLNIGLPLIHHGVPSTFFYSLCSRKGKNNLVNVLPQIISCLPFSSDCCKILLITNLLRLLQILSILSVVLDKKSTHHDDHDDLWQKGDCAIHLLCIAF